jgi:hypothetical protein
MLKDGLQLQKFVVWTASSLIRRPQNGPQVVGFLLRPFDGDSQEDGYRFCLGGPQAGTWMWFFAFD